MTNPADAYVPVPWRPDYDALRLEAAAHALVAATHTANADRVDDGARRYARAALGYHAAAGEALVAWFNAERRQDVTA